MAEGFTVNSTQKLELAIKWLRDNFEQHKYSTYDVRHGADRSLSSNALFHVWLLEYGCFLGKISLKSLCKDGKEKVIESTKRGVKCKFYGEFKYKWLAITLTDPFTGDQKRELRSSGLYKAPEMFEFLTWLQATAAIDGCILESKGEHAKRQRKAEGV